ncbi:MAG: recombinase family protein [Chloroflexi bacterium]|nr:recombinase family protein [Chloroflexota bacterium]
MDEAPGELAELLYALTGWVARMESQRRSERTKAGLARAVAQGKKLGQPIGAKDRKRCKNDRLNYPCFWLQNPTKIPGAKKGTFLSPK